MQTCINTEYVEFCSLVKTIAVTEYADFIRYETLKDGGIFMVLIEVIVMNVLKNIYALMKI